VGRIAISGDKKLLLILGPDPKVGDNPFLRFFTAGINVFTVIKSGAE